MQVLKRSGTDREKKYAARIIPVIANEHFLLVTLLLCNAGANEVRVGAGVGEAGLANCQQGAAPRGATPARFARRTQIEYATIRRRSGAVNNFGAVCHDMREALCMHSSPPWPPLRHPCQALPLFLDRLADPLTAVLLSTSVVLVFGEVLPQAVCSRHGLQVRCRLTPL